MKKLTKLTALLLLVSTLLFSFAACTQDTEKDNNDDKGNDEIVNTEVKIATLNGPTTIGVLGILKGDVTKDSTNTYVYDQIYASADAFAPSLLKNEINAAIIPANAAATLFKNSGGKIQVAAVNNLGVLYILEKGDSVKSVADLKNKTIVATGAGTTPQYSLEYILKENGLTVGKDVTVEYKSEAAEVLAALKQGKADIAMLPQPAATKATKAVEGVRIALDLNAEWAKTGEGAALVTGVLVVNAKFAKENPKAVETLLKDYKASCELVSSDLDKIAQYVVEFGIGGIDNAAIAKIAVPLCNIKYIAGEEMKTVVSGYLKVLFDSNPASVGGEMPADSFYYIVK
ncbi:MAG: ABC transporter substrate-binding protein [Clostridia bacterium]|nr:ABC transporter substrate-binding protein [Clostridia bacterium]